MRKQDLINKMSQFNLADLNENPKWLKYVQFLSEYDTLVSTDALSTNLNMTKIAAIALCQLDEIVENK